MKKQLFNCRLAVLCALSVAGCSVAYADPLQSSITTNLPAQAQAGKPYPMVVTLTNPFPKQAFALNLLQPVASPGANATLTYFPPTSGGGSGTTCSATSGYPCVYVLEPNSSVALDGSFVANTVGQAFTVTIPQILYNGNVHAPIALNTSSIGAPELIIDSAGTSENILAYLGQTGTGTVQVDNTGAQPLSGVSLTFSPDSNVSDTNNCGGSIAVGGNCVFTLTYSAPSSIDGSTQTTPINVGVSSDQGVSDAIVLNTMAAQSNAFVPLPDSLSTYHGLPWNYQDQHSYPTAFTIKQNGQQVLYFVNTDDVQNNLNKAGHQGPRMLSAPQQAALVKQALGNVHAGPQGQAAREALFRNAKTKGAQLQNGNPYDPVEVMYRSTDGGKSWDQVVTMGLNLTGGNQIIYSLQADSNNVLYAGGAVYSDAVNFPFVEKLTPNGSNQWSWADAASGLYDEGGPYNAVQSLVIDANNTVYAGGYQSNGHTNVPLLKTLSAGASAWQDMSSGLPPTAYVMTLIAANGQFYAAGGEDSVVPFVQTWVPGTSSSWTDVVSDSIVLPATGEVDSLLYANSTLYAGDFNYNNDLANVISWTPGQSDWSVVAGGLVNTTPTNIYVTSLLDVGGYLYASGGQSYQGFVQVTPDSGEGSWSDAASNLPTGGNVRTGINNLVHVTAGNQDAVMAAGQSFSQSYIGALKVLVNPNTSGATWQDVGVADLPAFGWISQLLQDKTGNFYASGFYYGQLNGSYNYDTPFVMKLPAGTAAWQDMDSVGLDYNTESSSIEANALSVSADGTRVFVGVNDDGESPSILSYVSQWNGGGWTLTTDNNGFPNAYVNALADTGTTVYAGGNTSGIPNTPFVVSETGSSSWTDTQLQNYYSGLNYPYGSVDTLLYKNGSLFAGGGVYNGCLTASSAPQVKLKDTCDVAFVAQLLNTTPTPSWHDQTPYNSPGLVNAPGGEYFALYAANGSLFAGGQGYNGSIPIPPWAMAAPLSFGPGDLSWNDIWGSFVNNSYVNPTSNGALYGFANLSSGGINTLFAGGENYVENTPLIAALSNGSYNWHSEYVAMPAYPTSNASTNALLSNNTQLYAAFGDDGAHTIPPLMVATPTLPTLKGKLPA